MQGAGSRPDRAVMLFATIDISIAAIHSFTGDILILLALSSRKARAWARLPSTGRHARPRRLARGSAP